MLEENTMRNCRGKGIRKLEFCLRRIKYLGGGVFKVSEYWNFGLPYPLFFLPLISETQVENVMLTEREVKLMGCEENCGLVTQP